MTDDSAYRLIDRATSLLVVPELPSPWFLGVEVVFLHDNAWIIHLRVWDAHHDDTACGIIREIDPFTEFASTYPHHHSPCAVLLWILNVFNDIFVVCELIFELFLVFMLYKDLLLGDSLHLVFSTVGCPSLGILVHERIRREEN